MTLSACWTQKGLSSPSAYLIERFTALKALVENTKRWRCLNGEWSFFETNWKPSSWNDRYRFVFVRSQNRQQVKGAIQLDLFIPYELCKMRLSKTQNHRGKLALSGHNNRSRKIQPDKIKTTDCIVVSVCMRQHVI